jgi:hypothetical protein
MQILEKRMQTEGKVAHSHKIYITISSTNENIYSLVLIEKTFHFLICYHPSQLRDFIVTEWLAFLFCFGEALGSNFSWRQVILTEDF